MYISMREMNDHKGSHMNLGEVTVGTQWLQGQDGKTKRGIRNVS